jgi:hypothetical protein
MGSRAGTDAHQHSAERPQSNAAPQRAQARRRGCGASLVTLMAY